MVNKRYAKPTELLKGLAKVAYENRVYKSLPPFYQLQMQHRVDESKQIKHLPFVVGDRVQAIRGPDKGKVGTIRTVYPEANSFLVEGFGSSEKTVMPRQVWFQGQTRPVVNFPRMTKVDDLQLVTKLLHDDGTEEDVAIHSIKFGGEAYDKETNTIRPIRRAANDESIIIPYPTPAEPLEPSDENYATNPEVADERTYFPSSLVAPSIPNAAITQFRNVYSRYNRDRYARKITQEDLDNWKEPEMPVPSATEQLHIQLSRIQKKPDIEFTKEMDDFISDEIEKGIERQKRRSIAALKQYT